MKVFNFHTSATQVEKQLTRRKELSSRQKLIKQIDYLDLDARAACVGFLIEQYPQIECEQAHKLINFIFENNFKIRLPNHFGRFADGRTFGYPYIWLLKELETGGVRYLYENGIWQIHWDAGDRYEGIIGRSKTVKYLLTSGPVGDEEQRLWEEHGLIFYEYAGATISPWQYPFPEDANLSCSNEYLVKLKLTIQK